MLGDDLAEFLKDGFEVSRTNFPGVLTIDATTYNVARSSMPKSDEQVVGGFDPSWSASVRLLVEDHPTEPELEKAADLDGDAVRIKSATLDPGGITWHLELEAA